MLQPFPTVEAKRKYDSPHCPVSKHSNPYSHWAEASETNQIYTKTKTECPHSDTGCDHRKFYISGCSEAIGRDKCQSPYNRFDNRYPGYHMETQNLSTTERITFEISYLIIRQITQFNYFPRNYVLAER